MSLKKWKVSVLGLVLAMVISGCETSSPDAREQQIAATEVVNKMVDVAKECTVTQMDCRTQLKNKIVNEKDTTDWEVILETTTRYDRENFMSLSESLVTNFSEDGSEQEMKSYMMEENEKLNIYASNGDSTWIKYDSKMKAEEISKNLLDGPDWENVEIMGMDVDTHIVDGRTNYKLTVKLYGDETRDFIFESGLRNILGQNEYGTLNLQGVEMRVDYYVDCETYLVSKMVINFNEMQPVSDKMDEIFYGDEAELQFTKCQMIYTNLVYEPVEVPELSVEEKQNAVEVSQ